MRDLGFFATALAFVITVVAAPVTAQEIADPYEILSRHFDASGGLDRLMAEQTAHFEGTLSLAGMEGTIEVWTQRPGKSRAEVAIGPLNITQGDSGEHAWILDQNGKLQVITTPDDATAKRREVRRLIDEYVYVDRESDIFTVSLDGMEPVDGKNCYVIRIANTINLDSHAFYINAETFVREKAVMVEDIESRDVLYGDYRDVEGLLVPFWTQEVSHQTGQAQEVTLTQYQTNPEIYPHLFEPPEQETRDFQFAEGDHAEDIPFEFIGNHLFIPVTVKGKQRLWVLDTGAGMTVLNKAYAEELGLELEGDMKGQGAGGTVEVSFATLPPFTLPGIHFDAQTAAVIDMDELIRRVGLDVVGILGYDFLSRFVTKVDYAAELVSFYDPATFEYAGDGQQLDIHIDMSLFTVEATLDGTHSGIWLFDLGAGTTHLDGRYALREGYAGMSGVVGMGHGAGNEFQVKAVKCDSMQFAGFTVYQPEINFSYGGTDSVFAADQIGTLGNSLFRNFVLYCDYANEQLIVEKGANFNQPVPRDNSGLQIAWNSDHEVEITFVSPDTPAEKAGFAKGDKLRSINGINVALMDGLFAIRDLLKADPGTNYELVIDRAGDTQKLRLELANLL